MNGMLERPRANRLPIGLLPAGSTNTMAMSVLGTDDFATCAIRALLGVRQEVHVGVRSGGHPPRRTRAPPRLTRPAGPDGEREFVSNFCGFGFFGEVIRMSEPWRCCGCGLRRRGTQPPRQIRRPADLPGTRWPGHEPSWPAARSGWALAPAQGGFGGRGLNVRASRRPKSSTSPSAAMESRCGAAGGSKR